MISARYFREIPQRYRLEAQKCKKCDHVNFPPRLVCPKCKARAFETVTLKDEGKLVTFTTLRVASDKFSKTVPFVVGIVETADGVRLTTQVTDIEPDKVAIGQPVRLVFRKIQEDGRAGILCYGYKAVPA